MLQFDSLTLKNVPLFKNQTFKFEPGLSVVYGLNKANGASSKNANAAGKSYFFSAISDIAFGTPIVGEKSDRLKSGMRRLAYNYKGKKVKIIRTGATKIKLVVDGKALNARTAPIAKEYLAKLMPYSEEEFRTFVFQDSRVPHPLVMGTTAERKRFFTSFFRLDEIDFFRKRISKELSELKQVRSAYNEISTSLKLVQAEQDQISFDQLPDRLSIANKRLEKARKFIEKQQEVRRLLEFKERSKDQIDILLKLVPDISSDQLENTINQIEDRIQALEEEKKLAQQWRHYEQDLKRYKELRSSISKPLRKLLAFGYDSALEKLKAQDAEYQKISTKKISTENALKALDKKAKPDRKPEEFKDGLLGKLIARKTSLEHQLEHARKFKTGACPTCGQTVKVSNLSDLKQELKTLDTKIYKIEENGKLREAWEEYRIYRTEKKLLESTLNDLPEIDNPASLIKELKSLPELPDKPEGSPKDIQEIDSKLNSFKDRIRVLEFFRPHLDTLAQIQSLTEEQIQASTESRYDIDELTSKVANLTAKLEVYKNNERRCKELLERKRELKSKLKREKALTLLLQAYSDKAIKRLMINNISRTLTQTLNKYAKLVFPEDYSFELDFNTQFSILVHRKYGKKISTSDVRKLSGAECKIFTLILIMAMLTFVPPDRRSSLLVLDEPSANFSKETQEAFASLLPILNRIIPSIVIITPKIEERYSGAKEFTVVKSLHGTSQIVEGHPSNL